MKLPEKRTSQMIAAAAVVAVLSLLTPKAAHAVAAALVQISNTDADPVISQSVNNQAAYSLDVSCSANGGTTGSCSSVTGNALDSIPPYTLPANQTFMVTAVDILPLTCTGQNYVSVLAAGFNRKQWGFTGGNTAHFEYPTGFAISGGQLIGEYANTNGGGCYVSLDLHGYLTAN